MTSNLLVVAFTPFPAPTGAATRLAQRLAALSQAGWSVDVLTPKTEDLPHVSKYAGARIFRVPLPQHRDSLPGVSRPSAAAPNAPASTLQRAAAFERAVRRQLQGTEYGAVYLLDAFVGPVVAACIEDTPVVYEVTGDWTISSADAEWLTTVHERETVLLQWASAVIAPTEEAAKRVFRLGVEPTRLHLIRPCVDLELFQAPPEGRRWRSKPIRIAMAASFLQPQELSLLAEALFILPKSVDVRVTASASVTPDARRHLLAESALRDRLALRDPVLYDDLPPFYQEADIGLVLSKDSADRGRLQTIAEMMASGLPMILPDIPSVRELVTHDQEALLVPPADVEALVQAIQTLASDPSKSLRLGQAGRVRAEDLLDEKKQSLKLIEVIGSLATPGPAAVLEVQREEPPAPAPLSNPRLRSATSTASTVPGRVGTSSGAASPAEAPPPRPREDPHEAITSPEVLLEPSPSADFAEKTQRNPT